MKNREKFVKTFGIDFSEHPESDPWWDEEYNPHWQKRCRDCKYMTDKKFHRKYLCNCPTKEFKNIEMFYKFKGGYACNHFKEK